MLNLPGSKREVFFGLVLVACQTTSLPVSSAPLNWDGSTGGWGTDASWLPAGSEPTASDDAQIDAGLVTVAMPGEVAGSVRVALSGDAGLRIASGGVLTTGVGFVGTSLGSSGAATVSGPLAEWINTGNLSIGNSGTGSLLVESSAVVTSQDGFIGVNATGVGSAKVVGAGTVWSSNGFYVGFFGQGSLDIQSGGQVNSTFGFIARRPNSVGTAQIDGAGSSWRSSVQLNVGGNSSGAGGSAQLWSGSGGSVLVGDAAALHAADDRLVVSDVDASGEFAGRLRVNAGSTLTHGGSAYLGYAASEYGTATVSGAGAYWSNTQTLTIGREGSGTLEIDNGGGVQVGGDLIMQSSGGSAVLDYTIGSLADPFMDIEGNATLAGTLGVTLDAGFTLDNADAFTLIEIAGTRSGSFSNYAQGDLIGNFNGVDLFLSYTGGDGNDVVAYTPGVGASVAREWVGGSPSGPPDLYQDAANWLGASPPDANDEIEFVGPAVVTWDAATGDTVSGDLTVFAGAVTLTSSSGTRTHAINGDLAVWDAPFTLDNMNLQVSGDASVSTSVNAGDFMIQGQSRLSADRLYLDFEADEMEVDGPGASIAMRDLTSIGGSGQYSGLVFMNGSVGNTVGDLGVVSGVFDGVGLDVLSGSQVSARNVVINGNSGLTSFIAEATISGAGSELTQSGASAFTLGDGVTSAGADPVLGDSVLYLLDDGKLSTGTGAVTVNSDSTAVILGGEWQVNGPLSVAGGIYLGLNPQTFDEQGGSLLQAADDVVIGGFVDLGYGSAFRATGESVSINGQLRNGLIDISGDITLNGLLELDFSATSVLDSPEQRLDWAPGQTMTIQGNGEFYYYAESYTTPNDATLIVNGNPGASNIFADTLRLSSGSELLVNSGTVVLNLLSVSGEGAKAIFDGADADLAGADSGVIVLVSEGLIQFKNSGGVGADYVVLSEGSGPSRMEVLSGTPLVYDYLDTSPTSSVLISGAGSSFLELDAGGTYQGLIEVADGGSYTATNGPENYTIAGNSRLSIATGASLAISGDVQVAGSLEVKDTSTTSVIGGDLGFSSGSGFVFGIDSATPAPLVMADASSTLTVDPQAELMIEMPKAYGEFRPGQGGTFVLIDGEGVYSGSFDLVTQPSDDGIVWQLLYLAKPGGGFQLTAVSSQVFTLGDTDGDGDIDDSDLGTSFSNYTGPVGAGGGLTFADGDMDGDGDVDDSDLGTAFSNYTGPVAVNIPEPNSLVLLVIGTVMAVQRRRVA